MKRSIGIVTCAALLISGGVYAEENNLWGHPTGAVKKDAYGLGTGMDQFGRPVKPPWK